MKRYIKAPYRILAIGLFSAILGSCSDETELQEETFDAGIHIGFNAPLVAMGGPEVSDMGTRSNLIEGSIPANSSFGVIGYYQTNDGGNGSTVWTTKYPTAVPTVFLSPVQEVTYNGTGCKYTPLQPWGEESYLYSFFAYYPYGEGKGFSTNLTATTTGAPVLTYTMPFSGTNNNMSLDETPDAMIAQVYDRQKVQGNINFTFSHLLTAIRFRVNNYDDDATVKINNLYLNGAFNRVVALDFTPVSAAPACTRTVSETYSGTYNIISSTKEYIPGASDIISETTEDNEEKEYTVLLLPDAESSIGNVTIHCKFNFTNPDETVNSETSISGWTFQPGYRYTINLNFIGDSYTINVVTEDTWLNGTLGEDGKEADDNVNNEIVIQ